MKKKVLLISGVLLTLSLVTFVIFHNTNNNTNNIISNINKDTEVISSNMITMMYETEAGSGIYEETKDTSWPESGYIFNKNLSGCENGGELEYNSQNNTVNLLSNSSDRCYVYFDKYDGVWIDNVVATNVTGSSVTINVSAISENGNITTYYYSLNDGDYQESTNNPIVIENLNKLTEYNIKIYAVDNIGSKSNVYEINFSTTDVSVPIINSVEVSDITTNGFTLTTNVTSDVEINRYYYIIESENIAGTSSTNQYTFNELNGSTTYDITIFVIDNNDNKSNNYNISVETDTLILLANWVIGKYNGIQGNNGIYYHTSSLANSAGDNSYRYAGASSNVNNYVCFGSDATTCPDDNKYRIIGVFENQVKLIKATSYGSYYWSGSSTNTSNTWSNSSLNTDTLNGTYLNNFSLSWQNKIATTNWKVGGMTWANGGTSNARTAYNYEVGANSSSTTYSAKIGLMYVSDYYYAATNTYWTYPGYSISGESYDYRAVIRSNWLYLGSYEWPISRYSDNTYVAFRVSSAGGIYYSSVNYTNEVRPVFYLTSSTTYVSGFGTSSDPIRIN